MFRTKKRPTDAASGGIGSTGDRPLTHKHVRKLAKKVFRFLLDGGYEGEVFMCGGAFKSLLKPGLKINDIDLWVRDRKERERLKAALLERGAVLVRDFHPYCIRFDVEGCPVEITYQNVKDREISEIVLGFDLAGCAIAATWKDNRVVDSYISERAQGAARQRTAFLEKDYLQRLLKERPPTVLRGLDRMERFAEETGYEIPSSETEALWKIFEEDYSPMERRQCLDIYLETTVGFKEECNTRLIQQAVALIS